MPPAPPAPPGEVAPGVVPGCPREIVTRPRLPGRSSGAGFGVHLRHDRALRAGTPRPRSTPCRAALTGVAARDAAAALTTATRSNDKGLHPVGGRRHAANPGRATATAGSVGRAWCSAAVRSARRRAVARHGDGEGFPHPKHLATRHAHERALPAGRSAACPAHRRDVKAGCDGRQGEGVVAGDGVRARHQVGRVFGALSGKSAVVAVRAVCPIAEDEAAPPTRTAAGTSIRTAFAQRA